MQTSADPRGWLRGSFRCGIGALSGLPAQPRSSAPRARPTGELETFAREEVDLASGSAQLNFEVNLDAEQRRGLGLRERESIRVLNSTPRVVMLEKTGPDAIPLPFDRDLVLCSDVRAFSLADLLQLVHSAAKSGFLYFEHGDCVKTVYLHAGEVVFATSNQRVDRLGECLLRRGVISVEQQLEADQEFRPPAPFGRFLVELGFLTPRQLWDGVKHQVEEMVRSLFAFSAGHVLFWEGEVRPDNVVRLSLPTRRLIAEGLSQRDELLAFLAQLEDPNLRLIPEPGAAVRLGGTERSILETLEADGTFPALCRRVGLDPLSGARTVRLLRETGAIRIGRVTAPAAGSDEGGERSLQNGRLRGVVRAHVKLMAELSAPIVALEGEAGLRERLSEVAREAAVRHVELLGDLALGPGGVLDPDVVIERALRFPGDRLREARAALGELVSYLEFELMNHPKVDDAEDFLEAMESLRAEL